MKKGTLTLTVTLTVFGSIQVNSAEVSNRWEAKDPYVGKKYVKEEVSRFNKLINGTATLTTGVAMVGYTYNYIHESYTTTSYVLPFLGYSTPNLPTFQAIGNIAMASTILFTVGTPVNMGITYVAKKGATVIGTVVSHGWDIFKYGYNTINYKFNDIRATYLQGTLWHYNRAKYEAPQAATINEQ